MATYAIGDVQGCMRSLEKLLERIEFDPAVDRLWFAGDLVNRGPASAEVLRFCRDHDDRVTCVLGNHDLHLLARGMGVAPARAKDTYEDVLDAPDRRELLDWLQRRPLVHGQDDWLLLHAGVLPHWSRDELLERAEDAVTRLRGDGAPELLAALGRRNESPADPALARDVQTLRIVCNLRCCDRAGHPIFGFTGRPDEAPAGAVPWYAHPDRRDLGARIVCGHWAAQGLVRTPVMIALDTGCVWGGHLTAYRLEDDTTYSVDCADAVAGALDRRWN